MNKRQHSKYSMYISVSNFLKDEKRDFSSTPIMKPLILEFLGNLNEILTLEMIAQSDITGYTIQKYHKRTELEKTALSISRALHMHFESLRNTDGLALLNINKSFYERARDAEFYTHLNQLISMVETYKKSLKPFGIKTSDVNKFIKDTKAFLKILQAPKEMLNQRGQAKEDLVLLFKETDNLLEQKIDLVMGLYEESNLDLYLLYKALRKRVRTK